MKKFCKKNSTRSSSHETHAGSGIAIGKIGAGGNANGFFAGALQTTTYDPIANRLTSSSAILGDHGYTPDALNRYASITTGDARTAAGRAPAGWNVQVADTIASRIGELCFRVSPK